MQPNFSFGATRMPFCFEGGSGDTFAHAGWQQAQAATLDALGRGESVAVLGPSGAGKSLLLRSLVPLLYHEGRAARLVEHVDLLRQAAGADVLLVDDAGLLNAGTLVALCAMGMPFVLAVTGQMPALPRPVVQVKLPSLTTEEVARFVASRLAAAGRRRDLFEPDAVLALALQSGGVLRRVNLVAGGAVSLAELEGAPRVLRRHVEEAATGSASEEVPAALPTPAKHTPPSAPVPAPKAAAPDRRLALLAAAGLGVVLTGGLAYSQWGSTAPAAQPPSPPPPAASVPLAGVAPAATPAETEQERRDRQVLQALEADSPPSTSVAPRRSDAAPRQQAPAPASVPAPATTMAFRGMVDNETMQQSGQMSLVITQRDPSGAVTARFRAWDGLLGAGELRGRLSEDGVLSVSGQLMMGQNPFTCDLSGRIVDGTLTGSANFTRGGRTAHAVFRLARS